MDSTSAIVVGLLTIISFMIGGVSGFLVFRTLDRRTEGQKVLDQQQITNDFKAAANEFLVSAQQNLTTTAKHALEAQSQAQASDLQTKKELIDQRLQDTNASLTTLKTQIEAFDGKQAATLSKFETEFRRQTEETLKNAQETLLTVADERLKRETAENAGELDTKKQLIDHRLDEVNATLERVRSLLQEFDTKQDSRVTSLDTQISLLTKTTTGLERALKDNRARGQLGEQMAESILELCGLSRGIDYLVQQTIVGDEGKSRPDFTFLLPNNLTLNMDSKFPLDNYLQYIEADSEADQKAYKDKFLKTDVRKRIKEVTGKDYINSEQNTLDYVLLFIPSEPIYRFVLNEDEKIFHEALSNRVVLCSPLTLYSIVQVIRQASRNYRVEKNSREILNLLGTFTKKWAMYVEEMDDMGKSLDAARTHYDNLLGTRTRMLQVQMNRAQRLLVQTAKDDKTVVIMKSESKLTEELDD